MENPLKFVHSRLSDVIQVTETKRFCRFWYFLRTINLTHALPIIHKNITKLRIVL